MTWDDVYKVLYQGSKEELAAVRCPTCGGNIRFRYTEACKVFSVVCDKCGHIAKSHGSRYPNCAKIFGDSAIIGQTEVA